MPDVWMQIGEYFDNVSLLGKMPAIAVLLAIIDMTLTFVHGNQERRDRLWRYFGAIYGFRFSNWFGLPIFFVSLTLALWVLAIVGILGACAWNGNHMKEWGIAAVGVLIGGRLADSWKSHIALSRKGYRPNPGLASVPFYIAEAVGTGCDLCARIGPLLVYRDPGHRCRRRFLLASRPNVPSLTRCGASASSTMDCRAANAGLGARRPACIRLGSFA